MNILKDYKAVKQAKVNYSKYLKTVSLESIFREIRFSHNLKNLTSELSKITGEEAQRKYKQDNFPYFNLGGFKDNHRLNKNLISTSFFLFDYDHLDDKLKDMKEQLKADEHVFAYFVSPRGNGLKVIYRLDKSIEDYKVFSELYKHYARLFRVDLGADPDKTSDASRPCYYSYDPEMYINEMAVLLATDVGIGSMGEKISAKSEITLAGVTVGNRTNTATQLIGKYIAHGHNKEFTMGVMRIWNYQNDPPLPDDKLVYTVNDMYERYEDRSKYLPVKFKEMNNSYFKTVKNGKGYSQSMITSFKVIPKELLVMEGSDCLKCDVESLQGNVYENVLLENTDWHTKHKFLKALGHQDCVFLGSDNDLQALCQYVQTLIPIRKTGTRVIGLHDDLWVVKGLNISNDGISSEQKIIPYDKGNDAFYHKIKYEIKEPCEYQSMIESFYGNILGVNNKNKMLAYLGWVFATPLKPKIQDQMGAFPLLFQHGSYGSGKTSLSKVFARLVGYTDPTPNSVTLKSFPMLKMLSSTNAIPQWFDEFKVSDMKEADVDNILRYMRKVYSGEVESKGRADQTIENYKLTAPMSVMGEWNINQPAILERVIIIRLNDVIKKSENMRGAFNKISLLPLEGFMPNYIAFCLSKDICELLKTAQEFIADYYTYTTISPRIMKNLAVMVVGVELFREFAWLNKLQVPDVNYESLLDDQLEELTGSKKGAVRSAVDQLIEELSIMAERKEILDSDYKFLHISSGRKILAINFKKIFRDFKVYAKKTNYEGDLLDELSYKKMFDDCEYVESKDRGVKLDGKNTTRCLSIDLEKAREYGVALEGFLDGYNGLHMVTEDL